ncbi:MAG: phage tail assembly protein [Desertifilum sp. SIO1I2]|nr:phage tail assembly protein [Desertifilum sp. SIO1I2]
MSDTPLPQTQFTFILPQGLLDEQGNLHRQGTMRLSTARDEIFVQKDPRVRSDADYAPLVMLSRAIVELGSLPSVTPELLENLFIRDLAYLREFYNRINQQGNEYIPVQCPECSRQFNVELALSGES